MLDLKKIISDSLCYPSGDNSQPFRFKISGEFEFEIHHNLNERAHRLNYKNFASYLTLGALVEVISLVAKNQKFDPDFEILLKDGSTLWAKVRFDKFGYKMTTDEQRLFQALPQRCVDRGLYEPTPIEASDVHWLKREASRFVNINFSFQEKLADAQLAQMVAIEEETWADEKIAYDVLKSLRFTKTEIEKTRDGLVWESLKMPAAKKPLIRILAKFPNLYKVALWSGIQSQNAKTLNNQLHSSAGFGWISIRENSFSNVIEVGRLFCRLWIHLNSRNYGFQPITFSTLPVFQFKNAMLAPDWNANLFPLYEKMDAIHREQLKLQENYSTVWGFRFGRATPVPEVARCLRKNVEDVLIKNQN